MLLICTSNIVNVMTVAANKRVMVMHPEITIDLVLHLQISLCNSGTGSSLGPSLSSFVNESYFACFDGHNSVCHIQTEIETVNTTVQREYVNVWIVTVVLMLPE